MRNTTEVGDVVTFPIHMKNALDESLKQFARQGFHYDILKREETDRQITLVIDTTTDHAIALGIKVGYNLKSEEHE